MDGFSFEPTCRVQRSQQQLKAEIKMDHFFQQLLLFLVVCLMLVKLGQPSSVVVSSVWCHGSHQDHRHCSFNNLCYSPFHKQYLFFHSPQESILSGIDAPSEQIKLTRLSSVMGNDQLYLDYVTMPKSASEDFDIEFVDNPALVVKRWRHQDLFHALHDELMPIYFTLKFLCYNEDVNNCLNDYIIVFDDDNSEQDLKKVQKKNSNLYEDLFPNHILHLDNYSTIFNENQLLCFKKATVGLESDSLWHDHGFSGEPSGPIENVNFGRGHNLFRDFRQFVLAKLNIKNVKLTNEVVVLLSHGLKNPQDLQTAVQKINPGLKVTMIDPRNETSTTPEMIQKVARAKLLIGFHGKFNVLTLFLPPKSGLLELFPYGLDQVSLSSFATLTTRLGIAYQSWSNFDKALTDEGPKTSSILSSLDQDVANAIRDMDYVGPVPCCNDPALDYKLDQVTTVDLLTFSPTLSAIFQDLQDYNNIEIEDFRNEWIIPAPIHGFHCKVDQDEHGGPIQVQVTWQPPLNLKYIQHEKATYEVLAEAQAIDGSVGNDFLGEFSTSEPKITFSSLDINMKKHRYVKIFVITVLNYDLKSGETMILCDLDQF